ncbi:hypothetical protein ACFRMN_21640 [Streptomyces sp. NPDC056835]|uniref:hypothetical protein n=1 Tax=Streptomyces sp. NPDC056835 TaxID=3345956 RepID=UPI003684D06A
MDSASDIRRPPRRTSRRARSSVIVVLVVMAALTAGWPLIGRALNDHERVPDGTLLELGPDDNIAVLRVTGAGWALSKSESDPDSMYVLTRDGVDLVAGYVALTMPGEADELWAGLRKIQSVADENTRLGAPHTVTSAGGAQGVAGTLTRGGRTGTATVWLPPDLSYAVEITVLAGPGADPRASADAAAMVRSVAFPREAP